MIERCITHFSLFVFQLLQFLVLFFRCNSFPSFARPVTCSLSLHATFQYTLRSCYSFKFNTYFSLVKWLLFVLSWHFQNLLQMLFLHVILVVTIMMVICATNSIQVCRRAVFEWIDMMLENGFRKKNGRMCTVKLNERIFMYLYSILF